MGEKGGMQFNTSIHTESNVLDLTLLRNQNSVVYSMDTSRQAFSTEASPDTAESNSRSLVGSLSYCTGGTTWEMNEALQADLVATMRECANSNLHVPQTTEAKGKSSTEVLYGLESLRKRGAENEAENEADV